MAATRFYLTVSPKGDSFPFAQICFSVKQDVCMCVHSLQSCPAPCDPMDCVVLQASLSMGFSRQEYWSGLPCLPPGDLSDPGIEPMSPASPALQADSLLLSQWGSRLDKIETVKWS